MFKKVLSLITVFKALLFIATGFKQISKSVVNSSKAKQLIKQEVSSTEILSLSNKLNVLCLIHEIPLIRVKQATRTKQDLWTV